MSTFAVFGMTRDAARAVAMKSTPDTRPAKPPAIGWEHLLMAEWLEQVERATCKIMDGSRVRQLSPLFDAPQFAEQFIQLARKAGGGGPRYAYPRKADHDRCKGPADPAQKNQGAPGRVLRLAGGLIVVLPHPSRHPTAHLQALDAVDAALQASADRTE